jgi:hypothetical protein
LLRKENLEFGWNITSVIPKILSRCVRQSRQKYILPVIKRSQLDDDKICLRSEVADSTLCRLTASSCQFHGVLHSMPNRTRPLHVSFSSPHPINMTFHPEPDGMCKRYNIVKLVIKLIITSIMVLDIIHHLVPFLKKVLFIF